MTPLPSRKIIRAEFHDYSGGEYFITIATRDRMHYFGKIKSGEMVFTELGKYAHEELAVLSEHYPYTDVSRFVIMPNHLHAIVTIQHTEALPPLRTALGVAIGGYKQSITRYARRNSIVFAWQPRYHDHIIRNFPERQRIAEYIENNVAVWENDCFYQ